MFVTAILAPTISVSTRIGLFALVGAVAGIIALVCMASTIHRAAYCVVWCNCMTHGARTGRFMLVLHVAHVKSMVKLLM